VVGVNNQSQKEIANVVYFAFYAKKGSVKEWSSGVNIVDMEDMRKNIKNGSKTINIVHMDVNMNVFKKKIFNDNF
jgi:hypothetical protein